MVRAGNGIAKAGYTWPALVVGAALRRGLRRDAATRRWCSAERSASTSTGRTATRRSARSPTRRSATGLTQQWGDSATSRNSQFAFGPVPTLVVNEYDSALPTDIQWNVGVQIALPWASSVDVSYVGHHAFNVLGSTQNGNPVNFNTIDLGHHADARAARIRRSRRHGAEQQPAARLPRLRQHQHAVAQFHADVPLDPDCRSTAGSATGSRSASTTPGRSRTRATPACRGRSSGSIHAADGSYSVRPDQADRRRALRRPGHDDAHHRRATSSETCRTCRSREQGR